MAEPAGSTGEVPKPRCIDPYKCYYPKPNVPYDYTVEIIDNGVDANENTVNTTFVYKCTKESKLLWAIMSYYYNIFEKRSSIIQEYV